MYIYYENSLWIKVLYHILYKNAKEIFKFLYIILNKKKGVEIKKAGTLGPCLFKLFLD